MAGRVKTRLQLDGERAVQLHRAFVADTLALVARAAESRPLAVELAIAGDVGAFPEHAALSTGAQVPGDLGARMSHALGATPGPTLIVGTDAPSLPPRLLLAALEALESHEVVFGPASDGGYVLIGARGTAQLDGVRWSSEHALADSLARNPGAKLLEPWYDVDTPADLALLRSHLRFDASAAPHSAAALFRDGR